MRLEIPIVCVPNERFIIRSYSPPVTIAGGRVLDNSAVRHRRRDVENIRKYLRNLIEADGDKSKQAKLYLETANENGAVFSDLQARTGWRGEILKKAIAESVEKQSIVEAESFFIARTPFENLKAKTLTEVETFHVKEPLAKAFEQKFAREDIAHLQRIFKSVC